MHARPVVPGLPALVLAALIGTMAMMSFVAVIGPVVRMLGLSEWHAGLSVTAAGVLWMLAARPWGQLSDRIGRKRVLMLAMSAYTVVYIALAVFIDVALQAVPPVLVSVLVLVGARGLIGLFYAAVPPTAAALIADKAPAGQRASFLARLGSANALGMVLGPAAAGWLAYTNLSLALYVAAVLPLLALALLAWRLPATPPVAGSGGGRRRPHTRWRGGGGPRPGGGYVACRAARRCAGSTRACACRSWRRSLRWCRSPSRRSRSASSRLIDWVWMLQPARAWPASRSLRSVSV
ncbi:MFS transporter [Stenotrophomonas sp. Sm6012]|nr:MFS transporter [Stenotrophomonas sp. Sm6012]